MRAFTLIVCAAAGVAAAGTAVAGQIEVRQQIQVAAPAPGEPPGMFGPNRPLKTGSGRIRGRVTSIDNGSPVRRAQVRISGPDIGSKAAMTDQDGRYEFRDLPAGRFNLSVSKSGFVPMQYGQSRPFEPGKPIELAEGQALDKANVSLPRGSVLSGRVVDEFGEPVADAVVMAMRMQYINGRRRLVNAGRSNQTNDLGQFRLYGLPPGDFPLPIFSTVLNGITVRGSIVGTRRDLQESLDFAADGLVRAHIHRDRLGNINDIFARLREGRIDGRVVLTDMH